jgi:protein-arginine kinase activator protein McsA
MKKVTLKDVKEFIRLPYVWPGGYERVAVTSEGAILCHECAKKNFESIVEEMKDGYKYGPTQWRIFGFMTEAVSPDGIPDDMKDELISHCDNCNKEFGEFA